MKNISNAEELLKVLEDCEGFTIEIFTKVYDANSNQVIKQAGELRHYDTFPVIDREVVFEFVPYEDLTYKED